MYNKCLFNPQQRFFFKVLSSSNIDAKLVMMIPSQNWSLNETQCSPFRELPHLTFPSEPLCPSNHGWLRTDLFSLQDSALQLIHHIWVVHFYPWELCIHFLFLIHTLLLFFFFYNKLQLIEYKILKQENEGKSTSSSWLVKRGMGFCMWLPGYTQFL